MTRRWFLINSSKKGALNFEKILIICLAFAICLSCSSCALRTIVQTDLEDYGSFREKPFVFSLSFFVFPLELSETWECEYYLWYRTTILFDDGAVYLKVHFPSKQEYDAEIARISVAKTEYEETVYDTELFSYPAYTIDRELQVGAFYEYALLLEDECSIAYIALQRAPIRKLNFSFEYLPKDYDFEQI